MEGINESLRNISNVLNTLKYMRNTFVFIAPPDPEAKEHGLDESILALENTIDLLLKYVQ